MVDKILVDEPQLPPIKTVESRPKGFVLSIPEVVGNLLARQNTRRVEEDRESDESYRGMLEGQAIYALDVLRSVNTVDELNRLARPPRNNTTPPLQFTSEQFDQLRQIIKPVDLSAVNDTLDQLPDLQGAKKNADNIEVAKALVQQLKDWFKDNDEILGFLVTVTSNPREELRSSHNHPLEHHRFRVSPESLRLMREVQQLVEEFREEYPESARYVGMTVFGSQTKSTAIHSDDPDQRSDFDGFAYFDFDEELFQNAPKKATESQYAFDMRIQRARAEQRHAFEGDLIGYIKSNTYLKDSDLKNFTVRAISRYEIDQEVDRLAEAEQSGDSGDIDTTLWQIFHLQLGHGLDKYRAHLLQKLYGLGQLGDEIWRNYFYKHLQMVENTKIPDEVVAEREAVGLYPDTVEKAMEYFKIPKTFMQETWL